MKISLQRFVPKFHDTDSVDFAEMQKKFSENCWRKTPTSKMIQNSDDVILYRHQSGTTLYTIMSSGYVVANYTYQEVKRNSVIPASAPYFYYPVESGKFQKIYVADYADMPFLKALEMLLMFRIDKNADAREKWRVTNFVDLSGEFYEKKEKPLKKLHPVPKSFVDKCLDSLEPETEPDYYTKCKLSLAQAFSHLTDKQVVVIKMYFGENKTQQQIAEKLGLSRTTVQDRLDGAIKKLKKYCQ